MKPVIAPPLLPYPSGNDIKSLRQFDADLRRSLVEILTQYAFRLNGALPLDGSEPMTGPLNIVNAAGGSSDAFGGVLIKLSNFTPGILLEDLSTSANEILITNDGGQLKVYGVADGTSTLTQLFTIGTTGLVTTLGQIAFPATQNPSTNANTLDDYEEGTWTPVLSFGFGTTGLTYSVQTGTYVKIGQLVFFQFRIILTAKGSSTGAARVAGLPFAAANISQNYTPVTWGYYSGFTALPTPTGYVEVANSYINLMFHGATAVGAITDASFTNTSDLIISGVYRAGA